MIVLCEYNEDGVCERCGVRRFSSPDPRMCRMSREIAGNNHSPAAESTSGPGTELSRLLKRLGIEPTPTCACRAKAAQMDAWGPDECEKPEHIDEVIAVMREEAKARGLPFLDVVGRMLVRRAIKNARKNNIDP